MKLTLKFILTIVITAITFNTFGGKLSSAERRVEDRHLSGFHAVSVAGSFDVYIVQGASESVRVEAPDEVIDRIITEVDGGVLKIYNKRDFNWNSWFGNHKKMAIYVTAKQLSGISLSGSGDVYMKDGITANSLKLSLVGSGDLTGRVEVKTLETSLSGSGDIRLSGHAESSVVSVIGSGDFTARGLATVNTTVRVAGSGDAQVNASNHITASVSGSGDVHYTGSAKEISTSKAGSGDISRM